ncbi:MAG: TfoX/Sxy family protein [Methylocella sp.]
MREFVDYLHEVFELFGPISARKMFSGYGIYHHGLMFGLVAADTLYLKADAENANHFENEGLGRFEYKNGERVVKMSYWRAPAGIMEDRDEAALWARRSYEAALRSQRSMKMTKKKTKRNS